MSGIKYVMRYGTGDEVLGNTYGSGDRSKFGQSAMGMALGTTLG